MSARSPRSTERVIYRGGWELSYRCAVSPGTIDVLKDLGWEVVSDKAVQRLVFVQITVYERWEPSYQFRLHAQQPDMNVSVDYVLSAHDLAAIMLPLFKGKSSKHVENALESSSFIPQDSNGNDIVNRALRRWAAEGWAPRRAYLIDWLLQRLRILEDNQGTVKLQLEPTQEQSQQWIEKETRRRFDALMGNKEMLMRNAKATEIQAIIRGHLARAEVKRIHEKYDQQLRDEKARMIQSTWKNHVGRKQLHRLYKCYMEEMKKQAAIIIQQQVRGTLARLEFRHTKDRMKKEEDAARMLQAAWRGKAARMKYQEIKDKRDAMLREKAAIILQSWFRGNKQRRKYLAIRKQMRDELEEQYAIMLQCAWRCYKSRRMYQALKDAKQKEIENAAAVKIQKIFKGTQGRKIYQEKITELATTFRFANAAVLLQKMMRGYYARMVLFKGVLDDHKSRVRRNSATNIQKHLRGSLARWHFNHAKIEERKRIDAAIRLQSNWRGFLGRNRALEFKKKKDRADYLASMLEERAAVRARLEWETQQLIEREKQRIQFEKLMMERNNAATMVQCAFRGKLARKEFCRIRDEYNVKIDRESAVMVQHAWRNRMARNKLNKLAAWYDAKIKEESAIIVQTHVRGTLARMQIKHMKDGRDYAAATMIQSAYRRRLARKRVEVLKKEKHDKMLEQRCIAIQCAWRQKVARNHANKLRKERDDLMREQAAIMLQCAWRQKLARNKFHELRQERLELDRKREEEERSAAELAAQKAAEEAERLRLEEEERNRETDEQREARLKREEEEKERRKQEVLDAKKAAEETKKKHDRKIAAQRREEKMKLKKMQEDIENAKRQEAADKKRKEDAEKRRRARIQRETKRQEEIKRRLALDESMGSLLNKSTKNFSRPTKEVYNGKWEMPCDLPEDTWVEVHVRVFERLGKKYSLRFEARPTIIWSNKRDYNASRSAKYTIKEKEMQAVLLPAFHFEESKSNLKSKTTKSGTSSIGGKTSEEAAMYIWAATEKVPRREKFIHYVLRRMKIGINAAKNNAVTLVLMKKGTQAYEIPSDENKNSQGADPRAE
eukprot:g9299.t1